MTVPRPLVPDGGVVVRRGARDDLDGVARVLGDAFADYPWTRWTVGADRRRERIEGLQRLVAEEIVLPFGEVWVGEVSGPGVGPRIVAAALWMRPDSVVPERVQSAVAERAAKLHGDRLAASQSAEAIAATLRPAAPHWYLGAVGVDPADQRRGYASAVLEPVLARAVDIPVHLETSTSRNVAMYGRRGFQVTAATQIPAAGPPLWAMTRPASRRP
jgi:GNAT superfamily N-acetyltransferase